MSNLHRIAPPLRFKIEFITLFAMSTASNICLPSTNAFWVLEITLANTLFNPLANTLANHLYNPPTKLIGLKSLKFFALPFFKIRTIKVAFKLHTKWPDLWNSLKKFVTSFFTNSHENCQNAMENQSGPEALSLLKLNNAPYTSFEKGFSSRATSESSRI